MKSTGMRHYGKRLEWGLLGEVVVLFQRKEELRHLRAAYESEVAAKVLRECCDLGYLT